jgi:RNase H-like domain found in reverse transcriptase/Reverse transcriptase (RNA-dependent DNA polymerase)
MILWNVAAHPYRSLIDGRDAYEQICVVPEHISLFTTPDGTMVSEVMQQGDCNGGVTYQALMNHIFAPYIGVFIDVYLDDVVVYSDSPEDHVRHVRLIVDTLHTQQLYLSEHKLNFFVDRLKLLGHVIDSDGIAMDPEKVDSVVNWKSPTNKDLLAGFFGAVGYLASGCPDVPIPMGCLSKLTGKTTLWRWMHTEQRAFDEIRHTVQTWRDLRRVNIDYSDGSAPINLTCDASATGGSGIVSQGPDLRSARIVAFWSGKFNSAQQNYPVHEQELLAIIESLKRFRNLLHGARFRIFTDHKGLEFIQTQQNLSPRQSRWLETLSDFDFTVQYIPGDTNVLADALSRIYSADAPGTVRAESEFVSDDAEGGIPVAVARVLDAVS